MQLRDHGHPAPSIRQRLKPAVLLLAMGAVLLLIVRMYICGFDAEQWRAASGPQRRSMVKGLLCEHQLVGMTRVAIEDLLGPGEAHPSRSRARSMLYALHDPPSNVGWLELVYDGDRCTEVVVHPKPRRFHEMIWTMFG